MGKFFRKDWILYEELANHGGTRPDTIIELKERTEDTTSMGHIPNVVKTPHGYLVRHLTGSGIAHQMTVKHHLVAIILRVDEKWTYRIDLSPGDSPEVEFMVPHGTNVVSYSFCNLHGLHRSQAVSE